MLWFLRRSESMKMQSQALFRALVQVLGSNGVVQPPPLPYYYYYYYYYYDYYYYYYYY